MLIPYVIWARSLENFFIDKMCLTLKLEAIWHCPSKRLAGNMILTLQLPRDFGFPLSFTVVGISSQPRSIVKALVCYFYLQAMQKVSIMRQTSEMLHITAKCASLQRLCRLQMLDRIAD